MTNEKAISALKQVKTYVTASSLDELDYAIAVLEKLAADGITKPLETNFSPLAK